MTMDWKDPAVNPRGLRQVSGQGDRPTRVTVPVEVRALAYFTSADGQIYLCAFIDETRKRAAYLLTEGGFLEVANEGLRFTLARMTDEIVEGKRA